MRSEPLMPQEARSLRNEIDSAVSMKPSFEATQPTEADGKTPNWFPGPKLLEPSRRIVAEKRYFSS